MVSPMVLLELDILHEKRKIKGGAKLIIRELNKTLKIETSSMNFYLVYEKAERGTWTIDPFDRLITVQAAVNNSRLLTKDREIRKHYKHAIW
jgi:PIN domain nuclease of toxin-antitoxin system